MAHATTRMNDRLGRLRSMLPDLGASAILVAQPTNVLYLTGFSSSNAVVLLDETPRLFTDGRYIEAARGVVKAGLLLYFGGMGSRKTNFYVDLAHRFGFGEVADEVQRLYQDGDREAAYEAIPDAVADATSLVGNEEEVAERVERFRNVGVDRLIVSPIQLDRDERLHTLDRLAALVGAGAPA